MFKFFIALLITFSSAFTFAHCDHKKKDSDKKYDTRPMLGLPDFFKKDNESFPNN